MINRFFGKLLKPCIILTSLLFFFAFAFFFAPGANAQIAVLNSETSAKAYAGSYSGSYSELWQQIIYTLNHADVKYSLISEIDLNKDLTTDYNIIILPLVIDLPDEALSGLEKYVNNGGKIIVIFPDSKSAVAGKLAEMVKISLENPPKIAETQAKANWTGNEKVAENDFPVTTKMASIRLTSFSKALVVWDQLEENSPALTISNTGSYIGWRWGNDGNLSFNVFALKSAINMLAPEIIKKEHTVLSIEEFNKNLEQIEKFRKNTIEFVDSLTLSDSSSSLADIQEHLYISRIQENMSRANYQDNEFDKAQEEYKKARVNALYAYAKAAPSNIVEGRTLWLDRETIISMKTPEDMANLFDKIQKTGINLVYFETVNAGYSIYPSGIISQNPLAKGRDPLLWAVREAHKRNIELHAWTWIFAVGNTRHNPIIKKSNDYSGPILSKNYNLALLGNEGNLLPINQREYWVDPANPKARELILSALEEIVRNYEVDGVQLDYIRYPFQNASRQMGFDTEGRQRFEIETGCSLNKLDENTLKLWNSWKARQISSFVGQVSLKLRSINPDIQISAAVFGGSRQKRMNTIQQDWETWVENGWVDILNPMIYSPDAEDLSENLDYFIKAAGSRTLIYPGIAVRQLEMEDLLEQIYAIKDLGLVGNTIFAMLHLGPEKSELLSSGPYRYKEARTPNKNPVISAGSLIEDFLYKANTIKQNSRSLSVIYNNMADQVISRAAIVHSDILGISIKSSADIGKSILMIDDLKVLTQNWLVSERQIKPATVKLLTNYLKEAETLLLYEQHRRNSRNIVQDGVSGINSQNQTK